MTNNLEAAGPDAEFDRQSKDSRRRDSQRQDTWARQAVAADPANSAWVSANAGTGKTHVLTTRVLRLLIAGTAPERILCLTYTKAAAAEMASRVFKQLASWVTADDAVLAEDLAKVTSAAPSAAEIERARQLFTLALETPGGLKVQTIHAFCERLLQRFPLEAGVPPGFAILDDETRAAIIGEAVRGVLARATGDPGSRLGRALGEVVAFAHDDSFGEVLGHALARSDWLDTARRLAIGKLAGLEAAAHVYRAGLGIERGDTRATIETALSGVLADARLRQAAAVLTGGTPSDLARADDLARALAASAPARRVEALKTFFLTGTGGLRKSLMTARLKAEHPDLHDALTTAQATFQTLEDKRCRLVLAEATIALMHLASAVLQQVQALKQQRAALDFEDLIRAAGSLLRVGPDAQWVLYKLDGGLDHILVDEAQDTSPTQWRVVEALAREFFAGEGVREAHDGLARTVFAVGDEKQSIYGFQGAAPKMFADMGRRFEDMARASRLPFERVPLSLSFRTVAPVLDCVDRVFEDPARAKGLTSGGAFQSHGVDRLGEGGHVEIWDTEKPDDSEPTSAWSPLAEVAVASPVTRLADRIAATIAGWLANGERLVSEDRPIRAGDILILVRKRRPSADAMVAALKARSIAVAGADRLRLTEQLVVKDLMALADFILLPEDDLSLASVLKSPILGLDDDDLLRLAPDRRGSLWSALLEAARGGGETRIVAAADALRRWRGRADIVPPYEFLVEVLVHDRMRERLIARLGPEAADPLDELMALALAYDEQAPPSLQGFIDWLHSSDREIKRDMEHGRDEVRVMTVHGSKGLEAPVVFLPDTCSAGAANRPGGLLPIADAGFAWPDEEIVPQIWPVKGASGLAVVKEARQSQREIEAEEHNRLLYVALTRARDRLYVAGFEGGKGRAAGCWYDAVEQGLAGRLDEHQDEAGRRIRRRSARQTVPASAGRKVSIRAVDAAALPDWAKRPAPADRVLSFPLAPSRLAPLETDADGDPLEPLEQVGPVGRAAGDGPALMPVAVPVPPPSPSPRHLSDANRFLRGVITHALLQHLPRLPEERWPQAAGALVAIRGRELAAKVRASIVAETLGVLRAPAFAAVFGPDSRAEVPVAAVIRPASGTEREIRLAGQIDRLVVTDHEILIVDFKTNRPPPREPALVAEAYVLQLAAYRLALQQIFPSRPVRAALLWTDGPSLMEIPPADLDAAADRLFHLYGANLDG